MDAPALAPPACGRPDPVRGTQAAARGDLDQDADRTAAASRGRKVGIPALRTDRPSAGHLRTHEASARVAERDRGTRPDCRAVVRPRWDRAVRGAARILRSP